MTPEQQGLIEDIAVRFAAAAPEGWTQLDVDVSMLISISGFAATATDESGKETPFFIDDSTDKKILRALGKLREDMAAQNKGRGAWYILSLHIPREGKPNVDFDYDSKPTFGVHVGDSAYQQDLDHFPRAAERVPEWLGGPHKPKPGEPAPEPDHKPDDTKHADDAGDDDVVDQSDSHITSDDTGTTVRLDHEDTAPDFGEDEPAVEPEADKPASTVDDEPAGDETAPKTIDLNAPLESGPSSSAAGDEVSSELLHDPEEDLTPLNPADQPTSEDDADMDTDNAAAEPEPADEPVEEPVPEPTPAPSAAEPVPDDGTPWWDNPDPGEMPEPSEGAETSEALSEPSEEAPTEETSEQPAADEQTDDNGYEEEQPERRAAPYNPPE